MKDATTMLMNATRLFAGMRKERLDAIVATMPENVTYSSGFWAMSQWIRRGPQAYVLTPAEGKGEPVVIASTGLIDLAAGQVTRLRGIGGRLDFEFLQRFRREQIAEST